MIHPDDGNADWSILLLEFFSLARQVSDYPVDLFNHCLGQDFRFSADLNGANWATSNEKARLEDGWRYVNSFAERPVSSPRSPSDCLVRFIDDMSFIVNAGGQ